MMFQCFSVQRFPFPRFQSSQYDDKSIILTADWRWLGDWLPCNAAAYDNGLQATISLCRSCILSPTQRNKSNSGMCLTIIRHAAVLIIDTYQPLQSAGSCRSIGLVCVCVCVCVCGITFERTTLDRHIRNDVLAVHRDSM